MPKGRDILGGLPNRTRAATGAYRDGWDAIFGGQRPAAVLGPGHDQLRRLFGPIRPPCSRCDIYAALQVSDVCAVCADTLRRQAAERA